MTSKNLIINKQIPTHIFKCSFFSCSSPDNSDLKRKIKDEILSELRQKSTLVSKGDGSNFYAEPISIGGDEHYIHHSTLNCPAINVDVQINRYKY